ncbi:hypothetical protein EOT10_40155 [Streptomyces antnestii]|uniref:Uncharacterized protein n=1 Tax=Streptomyces antnestii TaxID=2494256 RepID=A0A3S3U3P5_9ACTN|nr:hypothetical protein [Streptomyces sp. San01]RVU14807.1 hypothetical protein EOT10_40155 [Streptomyces sp. San01]
MTPTVAVLRTLAIDAAALPPAPNGPLSDAQNTRRLRPHPAPCAACGTPARATRAIDTDVGRRWLDLCRTCMITSTKQPPAPPVPLTETMAAVREAAHRASISTALVLLVDPMHEKALTPDRSS